MACREYLQIPPAQENLMSKKQVEGTSTFFSLFVPGKDTSVREVGQSPAYQENPRPHQVGPVDFKAVH